jgi:hypothetical protein
MEGEMRAPNRSTILFAAATALLVLVLPRAVAGAAPAPGWVVHQLTNTSYSEISPRMADGYVVWTADPEGSGDSDVFWLKLGEQTSHRVSLPGDDWDLATADGRVAWVNENPVPGPDNTAFEVHLLDMTLAGAQPLRLDEAASSAAKPFLAGARVYWSGSAPGSNDIWSYDASTGAPPVSVTAGLPSGPSYEYFPWISGSKIAFEATMGPNESEEIVLYDFDTAAFTRITDNSKRDFIAGFAGGRVVWYDELWGSYFYDVQAGGPAQPLTSNFNMPPQVFEGGVLWEYSDSTGWNVFFSPDPAGQPVNLTAGNLSGLSPHGSGDMIVWTGAPAAEGGGDIYLARTGELTAVNLSGRAGQDQYPYARDGMAVWLGEVNGQDEVFLAAPGSGEQPAFIDVQSDHPYFDAIQGMASRGIINGYDVPGGKEFRPGNNLWRAQFAKIIIGSIELAATEDMTSPFTDLGLDDPQDLYPHEFVAAAFANGITVGKTPTSFAPWDDIRRAQLITMVVRAMTRFMAGELVEPPETWSGQLPSDDPDHGFNIRLAEYNGILEGIPLAGWDIWARASRGEAAQILWNVRGEE